MTFAHMLNNLLLTFGPVVILYKRKEINKESNGFKTMLLAGLFYFLI